MVNGNRLQLKKDDLEDLDTSDNHHARELYPTFVQSWITYILYFPQHVIAKAGSQDVQTSRRQDLLGGQQDQEGTSYM